MHIESTHQQSLEVTHPFELSSTWHAGFGYATCGELIQGSIEQEYFLVNCPINYYSHVQVKPHLQPGIHILTPGEYQRLILVLQNYLHYLNDSETGLLVTINTAVPRSKGMASSTSELTAALCATAKALDKTITPHLISKLLTKIEPSDGTYYSGIVRYNQLTGEVYEFLGNPPCLNCIVVDTGGILNTEDYDRERARAISLSFEAETQYALTLLRTGFTQQSAPLIATAATISAQCNQQIHYNPAFAPLLEAARAYGALGLNCAHTGTVCGVLFDPKLTDKDKLRQQIETMMGRHYVLGNYMLIAGGL